MKIFLATVFALLLALPVFAQEPVIDMVSARYIEGLWQIDVMVSHSDTDNSHMLKRIAVMAPDGSMLAEMVPEHPMIGFSHMNYRIADVVIPQGTTTVIIKAECSVDGWSVDGITINLD